MVKSTKKRVMVSLSHQSIKELDDLCKIYDMTRSQVLQMLIVVFHKERMK